jgi:NAD(P)-dependent dehydrogenase (short-subunit alcohol dehydrogenase family)
MDLGLRARVAIVTGVSRGIGWSTARLLLEEGAIVVGVSRTAPEPRLEGLRHLQADVLHRDTAERVIQVAQSEFGRVDILVNNAGTGWLREGYEAVPDEAWRASWELLFLSIVRITNAALPAMLRDGGGAIVNVSSRNARVPIRGIPDYGAAKAALNNYSKGLAGQYAADGIRVVTVSPGPTDTPLWLGPEGAAAQQAALEGTDKESIIRSLESRMPHGRFVKTDEVADLIVYLASARAGSISGVDILIDAGLTQTL